MNRQELGMLGPRTVGSASTVGSRLPEGTSATRGLTTHLLSEIVKHGDISPPDHILPLETSDNLELGYLILLDFLLLLGISLLTTRSSGGVDRYVILVHCTEELLEQDIIGIALSVMDLDIGKVRVDTKSQVGRKGVRGGCPGEKGGIGVVSEGEGYGD